MTRTVLGLGAGVLLTVVLAVAVALPLAHGQKATDSSSKIKVDVKADPPADGKQNVTVTINIEAGWHIYANPVNGPDEFFEDGATKLTFLSGKEKLDAKVEYPKGKRITFKGDMFNCYQDSVTIKASVARPKDGNVTLQVKVQACDDSKCLTPGKTEVKVP